jgi:NAD+ synthase (glutamine-hydrolysing)
MKIALAQLNFKIGDFDNNAQKIIRYIKQAEKKGAELVIFPELALTAYPPGDFLEFNSFTENCISAVEEIATHCKNIAAIVGAPSFNPDKKGKKLFNSAYFLNNGKVEKVIHKTLLPTYDIFDEYRYFEPNKDFDIIEYKNKKIALTICEDIWNIYTPYYYTTPMDELEKHNPDLHINIAASPFSVSHDQDRFEVLKRNAKKYQTPVFYVNHVGAQTAIVYDGASRAINADGDIIKSCEVFCEDLQIVDTEDLTKVENNLVIPDKYELIEKALITGIKDYFQKLGFTKAILGLSGGIDSALSLVLAARALGSQNVKVLLMPSMFSSDHSVKDAKDLAENLGVSYEIISIENIFKEFESSLNPYFKDLPFNIAEENIQSRARGMLLMAFSNKFGHILINTSNKSEMAVGYGTLYGDMCGGLSVIGDLYKTEVFELSKYINREKEIIPWNTINKPPSAELKPDQKDTDSLPEYDILDSILFKYIDEQKDITQIISEGFEKPLVERVLKMVNSNEHKRFQAPPVLRVSDKAFGLGRRMPIVAKY